MSRPDRLAIIFGSITNGLGSIDPRERVAKVEWSTRICCPQAPKLYFYVGQRMSKSLPQDEFMDKKEAFLKAVQILAPDDQFISKAAQCVSEQGLPEAPGGAALEFVVAMQRLTGPPWACRDRFKPASRRLSAISNDRVAQQPLPIEHALKIKSAELWLKLGQSDQALLEIRDLPTELRNHPMVIKVHLAAVRTQQELDER